MNRLRNKLQDRIATRTATLEVTRTVTAWLVSLGIFLSIGCQPSEGDSESEPTTRIGAGGSGSTSTQSTSEANGARHASSQQQERADAGTGILVGEVSETSALIQVRPSVGMKLTKHSTERRESELTEEPDDSADQNGRQEPREPTDASPDGDSTPDEPWSLDLPGRSASISFSITNLSAQNQGTGNQIEWEEIVTDTVGEEHDYVVRVRVTDLSPNTLYHCATKIQAESGEWLPGPSAQFRTLAGAEIATRFRFAVVTGMNYSRFHRGRANGQSPSESQDEMSEDKSRGYPALGAILAMRPDFFVGTGDNVYYDTPTRPRAETIEQMRQKWHEQFVQPRYHELFARVPTYWQIDDHDYRIDDCDNEGAYLPSAELGRRVMLEQLPYALHAESEPRTYRTYRVSQDLQIWLTENRLHRSPNAMADGPEKTIWGAQQKQWLKETLSASDATFKILISPTPMIGPDDRRKKDNHTNVGGFQHERDEFFAFLETEGLLERHFYLVCGDRHWQYHSIHPDGVEEFSSGALIDANSRLGRQPGDPQSTDPDGEIVQPYSQSPASGGFLLINCLPAGDSPATLRFEFYDEHGDLLHEHEKVAN